MSKATVYVSGKLGIPEEQLNFWGKLILSFLPGKTKAAIAQANAAARELESIKRDAEITQL